MSDADSDRAAQIELAAKRIASVVAAANVIGVLECGMQIVMVVYGLSAFLATTKARRKGRLPYILISFVILVLSAIPTFLNVWSEFNLIYNSGPGESYYNAIEALWISGVVIISGLEVGDNLTQSLDGSAMLIHVCLNILVTLLIVVRLLRAHHTLSKVLPNRNLRVYRGAISIVIESALPFTICLFISGVVTIYRTVKDDAISWAAFATGFMSDTVARSLAALAPQMIIFRVTTGRSLSRHEETIATHPQSRMVFSQPLAFHHPEESYGDGSTPMFPGQSKHDHGDMELKTQAAP
ncbi:hypothetical protein CC1G_10495 [Coprinopsis cinerea okayama7|uniref:Uncharacterized protein n=1 Tax=Coprinopsis cinerea (strain Okayama-7 / 130 / ATCC MYA-4618 / FGSC 9003) TaxID=240176 RepID=A8NL61_COPC7|nr:hypothetical protein CC1G_10495 [Coprinopsis cinerea okayama7\|eukprot:XP_001834621.2 hypothetical protein CC1G_10495 [Coprinopsis cinerea okayama7\